MCVLFLISFFISKLFLLVDWWSSVFFFLLSSPVIFGFTLLSCCHSLLLSFSLFPSEFFFYLLFLSFFSTPNSASVFVRCVPSLHSSTTRQFWTEFPKCFNFIAYVMPVTTESNDFTPYLFWFFFFFLLLLHLPCKLFQLLRLPEATTTTITQPSTTFSKLYTVSKFFQIFFSGTELTASLWR